MNPFKKYRERANLLQIQVSEHLGVSNTTVSMWESGDSYPRAEMLTKVAKLYDCTVDELLGRETTVPRK